MHATLLEAEALATEAPPNERGTISSLYWLFEEFPNLLYVPEPAPKFPWI